MIFDKQKLIKRAVLSNFAAPAIVNYSAIMSIKKVPLTVNTISFNHVNLDTIKNSKVLKIDHFTEKQLPFATYNALLKEILANYEAKVKIRQNDLIVNWIPKPLSIQNFNLFIKNEGKGS